MKHVCILGGGIIGLSSAYYLLKEGYQVTVLDREAGMSGCSFGNAGMIVPSHIIPLASPGMIAKGVRWMFNPASPFYIRLKADRNLLRWGYQFFRHATERHVNRSIPYLRDLSVMSKEQYRMWSRELSFSFGYHERGLLMLYQNEATEREEMHAATLANRAGVEAIPVTTQEIHRMEPKAQLTVRGGVFFPGDAHLEPHVLMPQLRQWLKTSGVAFVEGREVIGFDLRRARIHAVRTLQGDYSIDEIVLAAGVWSASLAAMLGITLPLQAGKGYTFMEQSGKLPIQIPSILLEARVAVTPMNESVRLGGTMELSGINDRVSLRRVQRIVNAIPRYYASAKIDMPDVANIWQGLRPCSPDGLPYIGRSSRVNNLIIAAGHAMMGLSLGPGTGLLVSEIVGGKKPSMRLDLFDPERYSR